MTDEEIQRIPLSSIRAACFNWGASEGSAAEPSLEAEAKDWLFDHWPELLKLAEEGLAARKAKLGAGVPVELPPGFPLEVSEAINTASIIGVPSDFAESAWNLAVSRGGRDHKGTPIYSFRHYLAAVWAMERSRQQERKHKGPADPARYVNGQPLSSAGKRALDVLNGL